MFYKEHSAGSEESELQKTDPTYKSFQLSREEEKKDSIKEGIQEMKAKMDLRHISKVKSTGPSDQVNTRGRRK